MTNWKQLVKETINHPYLNYKGIAEHHNLATDEELKLKHIVETYTKYKPTEEDKAITYLGFKLIAKQQKPKNKSEQYKYLLIRYIKEVTSRDARLDRVKMNNIKEYYNDKHSS